MTTIKAIIKGSRLELDVPADWPDGTEVEIHPLGQDANGMDDTMSPEETLLVLISGGASALMAVPADGVTLDDKRAARPHEHELSSTGAVPVATTRSTGCCFDAPYSSSHPEFEQYGGP